MVEEANDLQEGQRVWTVSGYPDHGPPEGPKVDIGGNQGGTIVAIRAPLYGQPLIAVRWDNGQESLHYCGELLCIGPFESLCDFQKALAHATDRVVEKGPQGGFRGFSAKIPIDGERRLFVFPERWIWDEVLEPALRGRKKSAHEVRIPSAREEKAQEKERERLRIKAEFLKFVSSHAPNREQVRRWLRDKLGREPLEYLRCVEPDDPQNQDAQQKLSPQGEAKLKSSMRELPELAE